MWLGGLDISCCWRDPVQKINMALKGKYQWFSSVWVISLIAAQLYIINSRFPIASLWYYNLKWSPLHRRPYRDHTFYRYVLIYSFLTIYPNLNCSPQGKLLYLCWLNWLKQYLFQFPEGNGEIISLNEFTSLSLQVWIMAFYWGGEQDVAFPCEWENRGQYDFNISHDTEQNGYVSRSVRKREIATNMHLVVRLFA